MCRVRQAAEEERYRGDKKRERVSLYIFLLRFHLLIGFSFFQVLDLQAGGWQRRQKWEKPSKVNHTCVLSTALVGETHHALWDKAMVALSVLVVFFLAVCGCVIGAAVTLQLTRCLPFLVR
jgi:hypothetical protein